MRIVRSHLIRSVKVLRRVLLEHYIHRSAHSRATKLVGYDPLVDLHPLDHIGRDVIDRDEVAHLAKGRLVNVDAHSLAF